MGANASEITSLTIVYSTVYSGISKQTPKLRVTGLCVWGIHRWPGQQRGNVSIWWRHHENERIVVPIIATNRHTALLVAGLVAIYILAIGDTTSIYSKLSLSWRWQFYFSENFYIVLRRHFYCIVNYVLITLTRWRLMTYKSVSGLDYRWFR